MQLITDRTRIIAILDSIMSLSKAYRIVPDTGGADRKWAWHAKTVYTAAYNGFVTPDSADHAISVKGAPATPLPVPALLVNEVGDVIPLIVYHTPDKGWLPTWLGEYGTTMANMDSSIRRIGMYLNDYSDLITVTNGRSDYIVELQSDAEGKPIPYMDRFKSGSRVRRAYSGAVTAGLNSRRGAGPLADPFTCSAALRDTLKRFCAGQFFGARPEDQLYGELHLHPFMCETVMTPTELNPNLIHLYHYVGTDFIGYSTCEIVPHSKTLGWVGTFFNELSPHRLNRSLNLTYACIVEVIKLAQAMELSRVNLGFSHFGYKADFDAVLAWQSGLEFAPGKSWEPE